TSTGSRSSAERLLLMTSLGALARRRGGEAVNDGREPTHIRFSKPHNLAASFRKAGHALDDLLQSREGTDVSLAGGGRLDAEGGGGPGVAQFLEVPQSEHLAVGRVHLFEGGFEKLLALVASGGVAGRGKSSRDRGRDAGRVRPAVGARVHRHFPAGVPL